ncbi:MAG: STY4851/ECs_5259 family protein [Acidobacteriota bacterium]
MLRGSGIGEQGSRDRGLAEGASSRVVWYKQTHLEKPIAQDGSARVKSGFALRLLRDSSTLSTKERSELATNLSLRMDRRLRRRGELFELEARLELPARIEQQDLADLVGVTAEEVPSRAVLLLQRPDGGRTLAAVASGVEVADTALAVEPYPSKRGWRFRGREGLGRFSLWVGEGTDSFGPLEFTGCRLGSDLPWIFVEDSEESGSWRLLAEGSVRSRHQRLAVFAPSGWQLAIGDGEVERLGEVAGIAGELHEVTGTHWLHGPGARHVRVVTGQTVEDASEYRIVGETFGSSERYCGVPRVFVVDTEGYQRRATGVEWRPVMADSLTQTPAWRPLAEDCFGEGELRITDDGGLRFLDRIGVVPEALELSLKRAAGARRGKLLLSGLTSAGVSVAESDALRCEVTSDGPVCTIEVEAERGAPATLDLRLAWDRQRQIALQAPVPVRGVAFVGREGRSFETEEQIPVDQLSGVRALAISLDRGESFSLNARLLAEDVTYDVELYEPIPRLGDGYFEVDLGLFQETLRRMLSASQEIDAEVRVWVEADGGPLPPRRIQVSRFDDPLELDEASGEASISGSRPVSELRIEALPLWQPDASPLVLEPTANGETFAFDPASRDAGPWLLLGWDGDTCRYRPTLWTVGDEGKPVPDDSLSPLQLAIRIGDRGQRQAALATEVARLAKSPGDPGWAPVQGSIERQYLLPAATFELLRELIEHPAAAVGALVRAADKEQFGHAWTVLEQLPFSWRLVPLRAWRQAVEGLHRTRVEADGEAQAIEALRALLARMGSHRPYLKTVAAWLRLELLGEPDPSELGAPNIVLEGILEAERQSLFSRAADHWWPRAPQALEWLTPEARMPDALRQQLRVSKTVSAFKRPVLNAPLLAAFASALHLPMQPFFLFDLRRLRAFDTRFFDATYENGLRLALAG